MTDLLGKNQGHTLARLEDVEKDTEDTKDKLDD